LGTKKKSLEDKILEIEKAFKEYFEVSGKRNIETLISNVSQLILDRERGIDRKLLSVLLRRISASSDFFVYYRRRFILVGERYLVKRRLYYLLKYSPEHFLKTDSDVKRLSSYLFNTKVSIFAFDRATKLQKSLELHRKEFLKSVESASKKDEVFTQVEVYTDFINKILYLVLLPSISDKVSENIEDVINFYVEIVRSLKGDVKKRSRFYSYVYEYVKFIANLRVVYNNFLVCGMEDFYYRLTYDYMFLLSDISGSRDFIGSDYMVFVDYCYNVLLDRYILSKEMTENYIKKLEKEKDKLAASSKAKRTFSKTIEFAEQSLTNIDRYIEMLNRAKVNSNIVKS
jgi:hypothetical protein